MHDPRVARFLSLDPKASSYPFMSPYCYAANSPIQFVDVNGEGPGDPPAPGYEPLTNIVFNKMIYERFTYMEEYHSEWWRFVNVKGWIFEDVALRSHGLDKNNEINSFGSKPDAMNDWIMQIEGGKNIAHRVDPFSEAPLAEYFFTKNVYWEVKAYKNDVTLTKQIKAHIDGLAKDSDQSFDCIDTAADEGGAVLILVTLHGGNVNQTVLTYAELNNVSVVQIEAWYNPETGGVMFGEGEILHRATIPDYDDAESLKLNHAEAYINSILDYYNSGEVNFDWKTKDRTVYGESNEGGQDLQNTDGMEDATNY